MIPPNPNELTSSGGPPRGDSGRVPAYPPTSPPGVYLPIPVASADRPLLPPALTSALTPQALLTAFRRRWLRAVLWGTLLAAVVGTATYLIIDFVTPVPPKFQARSMLWVEPDPQQLLFKPASPPEFSARFQRQIVALVRSKLVLNAALKQPRVAELKTIREQVDPLAYLESVVQAGYEGGPEFLVISMTGDDSQDLVVLIKAITDAYLQEVFLKEHSARDELVTRLREMTQRYETRLKGKRDVLYQLALAAGANKPENLALKQKLALEAIGMIQRELVQLQAEVRRNKMDVGPLEERLKKLEDSTVPDSAVDQAVNEHPHVDALNQKIAVLTSRIEALREVLTPRAFDTDKDVKTLIQEQARTRTTLAAFRKEIRPELAKQIHARMVDETRFEVDSLKNQMASMARYEKTMMAEIKDLQKLSDDVNVNAVQMDKLQEEMAWADTVIKHAQSDILKMEAEQKTPARVRRLEDDVFVMPIGTASRQMMMTFMAAMAALGAVVLAVSLWEWRAKRIGTVDEVVHGLGLTVFGALPAWRHADNHRSIGSKTYRDLHWQSLFTESVDATRTMLLHTARQEKLRVVMVTSAVSGEGKTSLSTHLATSLARANRRTLLLDCDLRNPAAHKLFDLPLSPGFSEVLRGETGIADAVKPTNVNGLWMMTAGKVDDRALQALCQEDVRNVFERLKEQYEFIVVDTSPVLPVADSLLVGQHVDAVLFSILRDVSRVPMVYTAYQRLAVLGIRMLGAVVSGAREEAHSYGYMSGYGYGYRYREAPESSAEGAALPPESPSAN